MYTVWCASLLLVCVLATTFGDFHGGGVDARRHRRSMLSVRGVADTDGPVVVEKKVLVDADDEGSVSPSSLRSVDPPNDGASHASEKDSPWSPDTDEAELERNCGDMSKLFKDVAARYDTMNDTGVIVVDWSENRFNGIGDEMQHYQELLAIAIGTGRAPFLATQRRTCEGTGLGGSRSPSSMKHLATECHFDMGDYFTGARGVDWKWDDAKEAKVRAALGDDDADELVVTWSTSGMFFGHGDKDEHPSGTYVSEPDVNLVKVMTEHPVFQSRKLVRLRIRTNFGHWCHPKDLGSNQRGSWGVCESYRYTVGIEDYGDTAGKSPCPGCSVGGCFGRAVLHPREALGRRLAPYVERMKKERWVSTVAFHIRTGFADMSQVVPPDAPRVENATMDTLDAFLASEAKRVGYPAPVCPDKDFGAAVQYEPTDGPLRTFLKCVASTAKNLAGKAGDRDAWGTFMLTDSPAVRAVIERQFPTLDGRVVVTDGTFGHVIFANSGVCAGGSDRECDASDPRPVWERSMMDLYLVGRVDQVLMLYQSKFAVAAMMRAEVRHGQREMYQNTRITHSLVDPVVSEMNHGGWNKAETERKRTWVKLWDMFGPEGNREGLRTSSFASQ
jgi:hypothetical protein